MHRLGHASTPPTPDRAAGRRRRRRCRGRLPDGLAPLANSAGSCSAIAFLLGALSRRAWVSALIGVLSPAAMVVGYDVGYDFGSVLRGYEPAMSMTLFWPAAAVVAGPPLASADTPCAPGPRWPPRRSAR